MQSVIILTAKVISDVVASLLAKLPEEEKAKMDKLQVTNEMKEKLQEKIAVIIKPAFTGKNTTKQDDFFEDTNFTDFKAFSIPKVLI